VAALVRADLRPGVDTERSRAERVFAETQLIQAEQAEKAARAALAGLLGISASELSAVPGPLLDPPPVAESTPVVLTAHPLAQEQNFAVQEIQARQKALDRIYFPRFNLQAASYVRGSGAHTDGSTGGVFSGLAPERQNWAVGLSVTFPLMELPSLRIRKEIETHRERAETARYEQVLQDLKSRLERAETALEGAWRITKNAPVQLEAARAIEKQALARYQSGLANMVELADTERLLSQAEIDQSLANLNVWRGLLAVAAAKGDLDPVLLLSNR
jgi:outer membrane protein